MNDHDVKSLFEKELESLDSPEKLRDVLRESVKVILSLNEDLDRFIAVVRCLVNEHHGGKLLLPHDILKNTNNERVDLQFFEDALTIEVVKSGIKMH